MESSWGVGGRCGAGGGRGGEGVCKVLRPLLCPWGSFYLLA
jgi:hypothetical protein